ncbi:hypothetical protein Bca4012_064801 [Brassica carinata]
MKRMVVFMVMMLMFGNLQVESEVINTSFQRCFKICFDICIAGPARYKFGCFGKCTSECRKKFDAQDPKKEIDVKKAKDCVDSSPDMCDKRDRRQY